MPEPAPQDPQTPSPEPTPAPEPESKPTAPVNPTLTSKPAPEPETLPAWMEGLSDEHKGNEALKSFKTVDDLAQAALQKQYSANVPGRAEDYQLPDGTPEMVRAFAKDHALTQHQLNGMLQFATQMEQVNRQISDRQLTQGVEALKTEWGDNYDGNVAVARQVLEQFDTEDKMMAKMLIESRAGDNPVVIKFLNKIGEALVEDGYMESEHRPTKKALSHAERLFPNQGKGTD